MLNIHYGTLMSESTDAPTKSKNPEHYSFMDRDALAKYTTDTGKILPRKYTGLTPMQQRKVSRLIKRQDTCKSSSKRNSF